MANRVLTSWRAFFLFSIRLKYIDAPVPLQSTFYEVIEPGFRQFPVSTIRYPDWIYSTVVSKPVAIVTFKWKAYSKLLTSARAPENYRGVVLVPNDLVSLLFFH